MLLVEEVLGRGPRGEASQARTVALLSGALLLLFAVTMTGALGIKAPLDASVFSAAGGAFLLASCAEHPFSLDQLRRASPRGR